MTFNYSALLLLLLLIYIRTFRSRNVFWKRTITVMTMSLNYSCIANVQSVYRHEMDKKWVPWDMYTHVYVKCISYTKPFGKFWWRFTTIPLWNRFLQPTRLKQYFIQLFSFIRIRLWYYTLDERGCKTKMGFLYEISIIIPQFRIELTTCSNYSK